MSPAARLRVAGPGRTSIRGRACLAIIVTGYAVLTVVAGAPNSPLTTPLPVGARPPSWSAHLAEALGAQRAGRPALVVLSLAVMAGVLSAFALLLVETWTNHVRLSDVLVAAGAGLLLVTAGPHLLSRDVFSYAAYGRILAIYHDNPYVAIPASFPTDPFVAVTAGQWLHAPSRYGPVFTLASAAIVRVWTGSPGAVILAFKVVAASAVAVATGCAFLAARAVRPERAVLAAAVVGLNPVLVIHTVGGGHMDAVIAAALAAAMALAVTRTGDPSKLTLRSVAVTVLLTLAVLMKAVVVPALMLWLWWLVREASPLARLRSAALHGGVVVALSAVALAPFASGWHTFSPLWTLGGVEAWASPAHLVGGGAHALVGWLAGPGAGDLAGKAAVGAFLLVFLFLFCKVAVRVAQGRRRETPSSLADGWGSVMLLLVLTTPYLLPWSAAWFVPLLGLLADQWLLWIGVAVSGLLALTLIPADPFRGLSTWGVMLGVHDVVAPLMLGLLAAAARQVITSTGERGPSIEGGAERHSARIERGGGRPGSSGTPG